MGQVKCEVRFFSKEDLERRVRLWNEIHPNYSAKAWRGGWFFPLLKQVTPTQQEISHYLIDTYARTRRIIMADDIPLDAYTKTANGDIVCDKVELALQLETEKSRRSSVTSLKIWGTTSHRYDVYEYDPKQLIKNTVRALMFIKKHRPDIEKFDFLKKDSFMINILATAIYGINPESALDVLEKYQPIPISRDERKESRMDISNS